MEKHVLSSGSNPIISSEYLAFTLGKEEYALNISQVREIRNYEPVTRIATAPEHVKGFINLRGEIIPILDLRIKLSLGEASYTETTTVVITDADEKKVGFVVDGVSDVLDIQESQKHPLPDMGKRGVEHILGLGVIDDRTLALVDATRLAA